MTGSEALARAFEDICVMDAPLNQRLTAYADKLRELNFPFAAAYDDLVARLRAGEIGTETPLSGERMPPFVLPSRTGELLALEELICRGPVVISLNRGHWCPFCKIELKTLADYHDQIARYGAEVVSILPDRQAFADELRRQTGGKLKILSDIDNGYALSIGLVIWLGDRLTELMKGRGLHLEVLQGNEGWFVPLPATFVVGTDGYVISRHVDPDFRTRMNVEDILDALRTTS